MKSTTRLFPLTPHEEGLATKFGSLENWYNLTLWRDLCLFPTLISRIRETRALPLSELTDTVVTKMAIAAFAVNCKPLNTPPSPRMNELLQSWLDYALLHRAELSAEWVRHILPIK